MFGGRCFCVQRKGLAMESEGFDLLALLNGLRDGQVYYRVDEGDDGLIDVCVVRDDAADADQAEEVESREAAQCQTARVA